METRRDPFQAIADPTRRAILVLIAAQAMTPTALADHFNTSRQAVSKHIRILTECQLVSHQSSGREVYYEINAPKLKEIDQWIEQFRSMWDTKFNQLEKVLNTLKNKENGI
jgi:DNA-binding transcriptional ArsR family regulator